MILNWTITREDADLISAIVDRAADLLRRKYGRSAPGTLVMDLTACHLNGCPLDLAGLLASEPFDFAHDVSGIMRHIDRSTGQLGDCFVPRYARREKQ